MPRTDKKKQLIEFKGTTLPVVAVTLRSLQDEALSAAASALFGDDAFFDGDAALLELSQLGDAQEADWVQLKALFKTHGLNVIGVRGGDDALRQSAAAAGLPGFAAIERAPRAATVSEPPASPAAVEVEAPPPSPEAAAPIAQPPGPVPTMVVDRPLRSGQQIYARGGDLVVLAAVNAGAEVIADGSIHIYAPLRGRALAGAGGDTGARIFTTRFEAELVSIAGVYRTFDAGVPGQLAGRPVQVQLSEVPGETTSKLSIEALQTN
jgi:septum site-determining protein MinC